jgi:hypothetical protein
MTKNNIDKIENIVRKISQDEITKNPLIAVISLKIDDLKKGFDKIQNEIYKIFTALFIGILIDIVSRFLK